jgi:hypothetical protein
VTTRGRPSKLTPDATERLLAAIRAGATRRDAALAAGIHRRTFERWMTRAAEPSAPAEYAAFAASIERAEAEGRVALGAIITRAARKDWRAAAHLLAVRDPDNWAKREKVEHSGRIDSEQTVKVDALSGPVADAARNLADAIAAAQRA